MRPRREFSSLTKRLALARSKGICECHRVPQLPTFGKGCGQKLGVGNTFFEHIICDGLDGEPSLDNCAAIVKTCFRQKTDTYDLPVIAKVKRQRDKSFGIRSTLQPLPAGRSSDLKKKMDGTVVDRRTGEPWRGWR
jgi:5-methylcytosine-specific restriction protein A